MLLTGGMEEFTDRDAAGDQVVAGGLDVGDDKIKSLRGARRCRRDVLAEDDGGRRARRRKLDHTPVLAGKVGIEPPAEAGIKRLGAIDVGDGDDDDLELHVDGARLCDRIAGAAFLRDLVHGAFPSCRMFPNGVQRS
jgi:hypothetical protein